MPRSLRNRLGAVALAAAGLFGLAGPAGAPTPAHAAGGSGVVTLDGWGGLHPTGGAAIDTSGAPYWLGFDIARSVAVLGDGSGGYTLDGWGGLHPWGSAHQFGGYPYWVGWDIARSIAVSPDGRYGYELDGWGGLHAFAGSPVLNGFPYWPGWDIARGLDIHYDNRGTPDGGWVLDAWGVVHNFGAAPRLVSSHYLPGFDMWRHLHVTGNGQGAYVVGRLGVVSPVGNPAGVSWANRADWGGWDISRDTVPFNPQGGYQAQPFDRAAAGVLMVELNNLLRAGVGEGPLGVDNSLVGIAGNGAGYNTVFCGGANVGIADRALDMLQRNYFSHAIAGCPGTRYVFQTYFPLYRIPWGAAGENIAWSGGIGEFVDAAWWANNIWRNSPEHWANISSRSYNREGCGVSYSPGGNYQGWGGSVYIWSCEFAG